MQAYQLDTADIEISRDYAVDDVFQMSVSNLVDNQKVVHGELMLGVDTQAHRTGTQFVLDNLRDEDNKDLAGAVESAISQAFNTKDPMIVAGALEAGYVAERHIPDSTTEESQKVKDRAVEALSTVVQKLDEGERKELLVEVQQMIQDFKGDDLGVLQDRMSSEAGFHKTNRMEDPAGPLMAQVNILGAKAIDIGLSHNLEVKSPSSNSEMAM